MPAPEVVAAMLPYLGELYANPSSAHGPAMAVKQAVGQARGAVAGLIGAKASEVVFTSSATEANHLAILGTLRARPDRRHVVTTAVEHPSNLMLFEDLRSQGYHVTVLPVDASGLFRRHELASVVSSDTALVSVMWANNETGVLMPVAEAADIARSRGAAFHTDAVQAVGRLEVDLREMKIDLLTFSGHKLHGPKGVGVLFVRKGFALAPVIMGHQERHLRGGTENVPAIVGLGVAARLAVEALAARSGAAVAALRDRLEAGVLARMPGARVNGGDAARIPNTSNISFIDRSGRPMEGEALLMKLDQAGIQVSMGAACAAGGMDPSHVLLALGLGSALAASSLRFSLSRYTQASDIDAVLDALPPIAARLAA
ncbi:aminotransferase class V-fold PLP-dependent enzyme [Skermanella sp. TT6]|uniref:Cysteine desulfurase n=2 Tax=Skermanella cutis TaxID=2775420 RepID=A0ABX7BH03_9PROT|nr:aminotransferase class V-fold PLP-dependent enzyme [Skermanella sp. TT6]